MKTNILSFQKVPISVITTVVSYLPPEDQETLLDDQYLFYSQTGKFCLNKERCFQKFVETISNGEKKPIRVRSACLFLKLGMSVNKQETLKKIAEQYSRFMKVTHNMDVALFHVLDQFDMIDIALRTTHHDSIVRPMIWKLLKAAGFRSKKNCLIQ